VSNQQTSSSAFRALTFHPSRFARPGIRPTLLSLNAPCFPRNSPSQSLLERRASAWEFGMARHTILIFVRGRGQIVAAGGDARTMSAAVDLFRLSRRSSTATEWLELVRLPTGCHLARTQTQSGRSPRAGHSRVALVPNCDGLVCSAKAHLLLTIGFGRSRHSRRCLLASASQVAADKHLWLAAQSRRPLFTPIGG